MDLRFSCQVLFARNTSRKWTCCWLDPSLSSCPTEAGTKAHLGATFLCKWASTTRGLARESFRQCAHHVCSCTHHVWCPRCPRKFLLRNLLRKEYIVSSVLPQGHRAKYSSHPYSFNIIQCFLRRSLPNFYHLALVEACKGTTFGTQAQDVIEMFNLKFKLGLRPEGRGLSRQPKRLSRQLRKRWVGNQKRNIFGN